MRESNTSTSEAGQEIAHDAGLSPQQRAPRLRARLPHEKPPRTRRTRQPRVVQLNTALLMETLSSSEGLRRVLRTQAGQTVVHGAAAPKGRRSTARRDLPELGPRIPDLRLGCVWRHTSSTKHASIFWRMLSCAWRAPTRRSARGPSCARASSHACAATPPSRCAAAGGRPPRPAFPTHGSSARPTRPRFAPVAPIICFQHPQSLEYKRHAGATSLH